MKYSNSPHPWRLKSASGPISFISGLLYPFAFGPYDRWHTWWISILSITGLFYVYQSCLPQKRWIYGYCFGIGAFGHGIHWIWISISLYAHLSLAIVCQILFVAYLALYPALQGALSFFLIKKKTNIDGFSLPILWVLTEWMRAHIGTGFPWLLLSHSQTEGPGSYLLPWIGGWGVSLWCAGCAVLCAHILYRFFLNQPSKIYIILFFMVFLSPLGLKFYDQNKTIPVSSGQKKIKIAIIQGNIQPRDKWNPSKWPDLLNQYIKLSKPYAHQVDLMIWPEAAIPYLWPDALPSIQRIQRACAPAVVLSGIIEQSKDRFYNALINCKTYEIYRKIHLVPLGEYTLTWPWFLDLVSFFHIPMSNLSRGSPQQQPMIYRHIAITPSICYEIADDFILSRHKNAKIILNITDDSWFGRSHAAAQQLQIAKFQAKVLQKPVIISASDGISAIINEKGVIQAQTQRFQCEVIQAEIKIEHSI